MSDLELEFLNLIDNFFKIFFCVTVVSLVVKSIYIIFFKESLSNAEYEKEHSGYNYRLNYCAEKVKVRLNYSTVKMLIENESPYLKICNIDDFTDVLFLKDEKGNTKVIQLSWEDYKKIKNVCRTKEHMTR